MSGIVIRTGIDLLEIDRLSALSPRIRERFLKRVFTEQEQIQAGGSMQSLAGRFCAKEAFAKALGCGIGKISWHDVEILTNPEGAPTLKLHGKAQELAATLSLTAFSVSISHTRQIAAATVTALGLPDNK